LSKASVESAVDLLHWDKFFLTKCELKHNLERHWFCN
jgi:hypothetical protein